MCSDVARDYNIYLVFEKSKLRPDKTRDKENPWTESQIGGEGMVSREVLVILQSKHVNM